MSPYQVTHKPEPEPPRIVNAYEPGPDTVGEMLLKILHHRVTIAVLALLAGGACGRAWRMFQ